MPSCWPDADICGGINESWQSLHFEPSAAVCAKSLLVPQLMQMICAGPMAPDVCLPLARPRLTPLALMRAPHSWQNRSPGRATQPHSGQSAAGIPSGPADFWDMDESASNCPLDTCVDASDEAPEAKPPFVEALRSRISNLYPLSRALRAFRTCCQFIIN